MIQKREDRLGAVFLGILLLSVVVMLFVGFSGSKDILAGHATPEKPNVGEMSPL